MTLVLTPNMPLNPGRCLICACTPLDETKENRPPLPAVHAEGIDVNWGDAVYICWTCAGVVADLVGRPSEDTVRTVVRGARLQKKENEKVRARNEEVEGLLRSMVEGDEARTAAREAVNL